MQLESHATPCGGTPQHRYATLHRAIERGIDSDDIWFELAEVSAVLGHENEATRCAQRVRDNTRRVALERRLARLEQVRVKREPGKPAAAPVASNTGPAAQPKESDTPEPSVTEHLLDAGQYLMHQHMPWLVLTTMLAFPLVVGVGGFLTAGGSPLLLAAIAALPGLSVLAVVAAMGSRILLTSSEGVCDVPNIPDIGNLIVAARRFALDAVMVLVLFFGAAAVLIGVGASWTITLPALALGTFFAPAAFAVRHIRGDLRALTPLVLLRTVRRCGTGYPIVAAVTTLMFAPALGVAWAVYDRPIWVQIAIVGPMCVLPVFAAARLLGSWMDTRRDALGYLLHSVQQVVAGSPGETAARTLHKPAPPRMPARPEALEKFRPPAVKPTRSRGRSTPVAAAVPGVQEAGETPRKPRYKKPAPRAIEGRRPSQANGRQAPPVRPALARPSLNRADSPKPAPAPIGPAAGKQGSPDLVNMPGAVVVSGKDRIRQGAASRRP